MSRSPHNKNCDHEDCKSGSSHKIVVVIAKRFKVEVTVVERSQSRL